MCYSPEASFAATGFLTLSGIYFASTRVITKRNIMLAAIPFIFATHQFSEGLIWLSFDQDPKPFYTMHIVWFYVIIAHLFWPIYIPVSIIQHDRPSNNKFKYYFWLLFGVAISTYLLWCMTINSDMVYAIACDRYSIEYYFDVPYKDLTRILFLLSVTMPFFISSNKKFKWVLGPAWAFTFIVAKIIAGNTTLPSIWCFFAAIISIIIFRTFETKGQISISEKTI
jgi:hypothetical protein